MNGEAKRVEASSSASAAAAPWPGVPAKPAEAEFIERPLSAAQQTRWLHYVLAPASAAYNVNFTVELDEAVDLGTLRHSVRVLVERHSALRTTYAERPSGSVQLVWRDAPDVFRIVDLEASAAFELDRVLRAEADRPFDLERGPVLRVNAVRLGGRPARLQVVVHHIAMDFASIGIFLEELSQLQDAFSGGPPSRLPPPAGDYGDYAEGQRAYLASVAGREDVAYWHGKLHGDLPVLALPADHPYPEHPTFAGSTVVRQLDERQLTQIRRLARDNRVTPYLLVLTCFALWLRRLCGQDEVIVGTPIGDRPDEAAERMIGDFVNTLPLRLDLAGRAGFESAIAYVREEFLEAMEHARVPISEMLGESRVDRTQGASPVFQALFVWNRFGPGAGLEAPPSAGLRLDTLDGSSTGANGSTHEISLMVVDRGDGLDLRWTFNAAIFEATTMERLADGFHALLAPLIDAAVAPASNAAMPDPRWNETEAPFPHESGMHELIEAQVRQSPDRIAVVCPEQGSLTYDELNRRANRLARHLISCGVGRDAIVGLFLERSLEMVIAILATMKAGGAYLPLDTDMSEARLRGLVDDARPRLVLTQQRFMDLMAAAGIRALALDMAETDPLLSRRSGRNPSHRGLRSSDLAYVLYTSGSTGAPKGVMIEHRAFVNRICWMQKQYPLASADVVLQKTPYFFDVSGWEFVWPLIAGAKLVLARPHGHKDPAYLTDLIRAERVTVLHFVPSMLTAMLEEEGFAKCDSIRRVFASGEALSVDVEQRFFERLPGAELHNLYGPTEAAIDVSYWACRPGHGGATVPIGRPIDNVTLHILDAAGEPVAVGEAGEIYIGGVALARGYLNRPELTTERFISDPRFAGGARLYRTGDLGRFRPDGNIEFIGRMDRQIKIRGLRLELAEVELALKACQGIGQAFVDTVEGRGGQRRLVGFFVADAGSSGDVDRIRRDLADRLPEYAIPSMLIEVDSFPVTPNGKLDRAVLLGRIDREADARPYVAPRSGVERRLCSIFEEVLGVERVGLDDGFFELGGDSLSSLRVLARARNAGLHFQLEQLIVLQTVRRLAEAVHREDRPASASLGAVAPLPSASSDAEGVEGVYPLSALQAGMIYHNVLARRANTYHEVSRYRVTGPFDEAGFRAALASLCREHEVLRTSFLLDATPEPLQCVWRECEIPLIVIDLRETDEAAQRQALDDWKAAERLAGFDWTQPPLLRCFVHRLAADEFILSLSFSHAILDGWSAAVLLVKLLERAQRPADISATGQRDSGFRQFIALEREAAASAVSADFWRSEVRAMAPARCVGEQAGEAEPVGNVATTLGPELLARASSLARRHSVSLRSVLLAAHLKVLASLRGEGEVVTGLVVNGRPEVEHAETMLGLFLNTVPFRLDVEGASLSTLVAAVAGQEAAITPHRRFPYNRIQELAGGRPLFDVAFHFVHFHALDRANAPGGWSVAIEELYGETNFPLLVSFMRDTDAPVLKLQLSYQPRWFARDFAERLLGFYAGALEALLAEPETVFTRADLDAFDPQVAAGSPLAEQAPPPPREDEAAWAERLAGAPELHPLPLDRPRPASKGLSARCYEFPIDGGLAARLAQLPLSASPRSLLRAAFVVLAARLARTEELVVGVAAGLARDAAGRPLGAFEAAVPVRAEVGGKRLLLDLLEVLAERIEAAELTCPPDLRRLARSLGHEAADSHAPVCQLLVEGGETGSPAPEGGFGFDLAFGCDAGEGGGLACRIAYDPALFRAATIEMLGASLATLLAGLVADPAAAAGELPLVGQDDAARASRIDAAETAALGALSLHAAVRRQAAASPQRAAVVAPDGALTYAELDARSDALAGMMLGRGLAAGAHVGICLPRCADLVVAIVAVLKAGGAYVPLDPASPADRLRYILNDSGTALLLSHAQVAEQTGLADWPGLLLLDAPDTRRELARPAPPDLAWPADEPERSCYVIYTSGSTGQPKGVVVRHANVLRLFGAAQPLFGFGAEEVWTLFHSYAFDFSVWEIFGALLYGGRLVVVGEEVAREPPRFLELMASEGVTMLNQTPSAFSNLLAALGPNPPNLERLRWVVLGGEALDPRKLRPWFDAYGFDRVAVVNMYGITETTVHVTYKRIGERELDEGLSAIGRPLPDLSIAIVDEGLKLVPRGAKGELCVGGAGVAQGYLNREALTRQRFLERGELGPDRVYRSGDLARMTADGELEYLGRIDRQVKIRGFRIELGEIENQIVGLCGASNAVVRVLAGGSGPDRLVAYVVAPEAPSAAEWQQQLRARLGQVLPDYMIPSFFCRLDAIPLTTNGKIDVAALPDPRLGAAGRGEAPPRDALERSLVEIFEAVTQVRPVGIDDDFYALGGDSIRVVQVVAKLERLGHVIDGACLLQHRSVAALADYLRSRSEGAGQSRAPAPLHLVSDMAEQRGPGIVDAYSVTDTQQLMLEQHARVTGAYHPQHVFEIRDAAFSPAAFSAALERRLSDHACLRSSFRPGPDGRYIQCVHAAPAAPEIAVVDVSGLAADERQQAIDRYLARDLAAPFDPGGTPPLMRFGLFKGPQGLWNLAISSHHAIEDGWGFVELIRSVMTLYAAVAAGRPLPERRPVEDVFKERVALEREAQRDAEARAFWTRLLESVAAPSPDLADRVRAPSHHVLTLQRPTGALRSACERRRSSLRGLFLLAYAQALAPLFGPRPPVVDVVTNGRSNRLSDPIGGIGLFWSLLPIPVDLASDAGREPLVRLDERLAQAERHAMFPVSDLVGAARAALTPAAFNYTHFHNAGPPVADFSLVKAVDRFHHPIKLAVSVSAAGDAAALDLEYDESIGAESATDIATRLAELIDRLAVDST